MELVPFRCKIFLRRLCFKDLRRPVLKLALPPGYDIGMDLMPFGKL